MTEALRSSANSFRGEGDALLWDSNYQRKAAYNAFLRGIQEPVN
jgi:hypothetical protein